MRIIKPKFWDIKKKSLWSLIFFPFAILYFLIFFIKKFKKKKNFKIPIICVGNIYLGGTGKTPIVLELFNILKDLNKNPGFVKKYYDYIYDEINMLKNAGPTFVSRNRAEAIENLITKNHDVAILDDGFQDFSINKNFSLICFSSNQWIGNGFLLPSGPLREPFSAIKRADCIVINGKKNIEIENKILKEKNTKIFYSKYIPENIDKFKNNKIIAFAGIGNPINFIDLLNEYNLNIVDTISFPDHYTYKANDLNLLKKKANKLDATLVTTEKDYMRLDNSLKTNINYLKVKLEIENKERLIELLKSKL